jgi:hypothetical protein
VRRKPGLCEGIITALPHGAVATNARCGSALVNGEKGAADVGRSKCLTVVRISNEAASRLRMP